MFNLIANTPNRTAFIENDISYSYSYLRSEILSLKKFLDFKGLLMLNSDNDKISLVVYCACLEFKIPIILVENLANIYDKNNIIENYLPYFIVTKAELSHKNYEKIHKVDNYFFYKYKKKEILCSNNISLLLSTSGTLGNKKFVILSKKNLLTNTEQIIDYLKITKKDVVITTLPFSYSYGISIINTHLYKRATIILNQSSVLEKNFYEKILNYKVTNFGGVPFTYSILNKINFFRKDLSSLKYVTQAGGKIKNNDFDKIYNLTKIKKIKFIIMYGQTEASPRISYVPYKSLPKKKDSIGIPIKNSNLEIISSKGTRINKPFIEGELQYKGSNIFLNYSEGYKDLIKKHYPKKKLFTGDIGYFDNDGYFYIVGRKKRIIKLFGQRINLDLLDTHLNKKFKCYCMDYQDKLFIYTESKNSEMKIYDHLKKIISINKNFIQIKYVEVFDKNENGKVIMKNYD